MFDRAPTSEQRNAIKQVISNTYRFLRSGFAIFLTKFL